MWWSQPPNASTAGSFGAMRLGRRAALGTVGAGIASFVVRPARAYTLPPLPAVLTRLPTPKAAPVVHFATARGEQRTLAGYRGKGLVLNIWATWCPPCRAELPTLNRLSKIVASDGIDVLPVSIDTGGRKAVTQYYADHHITHLPVLLNPSGGIVTALNVQGTPTTFLIDRQGGITGFVEGAADWDAPASVTMLRQIIGQAE